MNLTLIVGQLRAERAALDEAIAILERIGQSGTLGQGRPPKWLSAGKSGSKRVFSAATRVKMAEGQRKRWEAYRKAKEQG
ncbi:MAG TPA: hypothetical protein VIY49_04625 [Bryobacteraceae bacterium]